MGIVGEIFTVTLLFITAGVVVIRYISLIRRSQTKQIKNRTVPRRKIPADGDRIMEETKLEKTKRK